MPVRTEHKLYQKRKKDWELIRDCIEGEDAIKNAGVKYLPMAICRTKFETEMRYNAYRKRARFVNYTEVTRNILQGLVFRKKVTAEIPEGLKSIYNDVDRQGTAFQEFATDVFKDLLATSFGGVLADLPAVNGEISMKEAEDLNIRTYLTYYPAEDIINWKYGVSNGKKQLIQVVLREKVEVPINDFQANEIEQYRVLELVGNVYQQRLFTPATDGNDWNIDVIPITTAKGDSLDFIPFVTLGSKEPMKPMLLDLAKLNIGHYQKIADYENGIHYTTIPTGYVTGHRRVVDEETGEEEPIVLGGDSFLVFEEADAKVGTLCFAGEGLEHSEKAISMAEQNIRTMGRRIVTPDSTRSAEAAMVDQEAENANLATFVNKVSLQFTKLFKMVARMENVEYEEIWIKLCTDYNSKAFDPNGLNAIANLAEAGRWPLPYIFEVMQNGELAPADSNLEEYITLLDLESSGVSPMEIYEAYKTLRKER